MLITVKQELQSLDGTMDTDLEVPVQSSVDSEYLSVELLLTEQDDDVTCNAVRLGRTFIYIYINKKDESESD